MRRDRIEDSLGSKIFYIAEPVAVNINFLKTASWLSDEKWAYGKFTLSAKGAKTLSINFSNFLLPRGTEMYIYNKEAEMITGVITEAENNKNRIWGSSIYKGEELTIEVKLPLIEKDNLSLFITNVAYGYRDIFINKIAGFGQSGSCNINVLCPLGNSWELERNSVVFIARSNGDALCSDSMLMNTCAANIPYILTADHCFQGDGNVAGWKVHFQAWSATCTPSQNSDGILFNGSTLRANWQPSDFCLIQLNQSPPINSGIHYAGWSKQTTAATSGVGIHHPSGDVMKISDYTIPLVREDDPTRCGINTVGQLHWVVQWNQGVTEGGSSGSPIFDQNHRVVGQLSGGPSSCAQPNNCRLDMYGRFDNSWTGGGTNSSRLSNWLDPSGTNALTTNTTNISDLLPQTLSLNITGGANYICENGSISTYTVTGAPAGQNIVWSISNASIATLTFVGNQATVTKTGNGELVLSATVGNGACFSNNVALKAVRLGIYTTAEISFTPNYAPPFGGYYAPPFCSSASVYFRFNNPSLQSNASAFQWAYSSGWTYQSGQGTAILNLRATPGPSHSSGTVAVRVSNGCGSSNVVTPPVNYAFQKNCTAAKFTISPNPSSEFVTVTQSIDLYGEKQSTRQIQEIIFTDKMGINRLKKSFAKGISTTKISVADLPNDVYVVRIFDGEFWQSELLIIRHQ